MNPARPRRILLRKQDPTSTAIRFAKSAGFALLGFAATAIPLHLALRRQLRDAPEDIREQGWPIRLMQVIFWKYILKWLDVEGLENLPSGSYLIAANHAYKSGVDGYILGHLIASRGGRVPRILMTSENRNWMVRAERWALHHYGIALLVPDENPAIRRKAGLSDVIAKYLTESSKHAVLIFPAGRAIADPALQLKNWSTGVVIAAEKSGCPIVPVAVGGLRLDWSAETVVFAALDAKERDAKERDAKETGAKGSEPPFHFHIRIGKPIMPTGDAHQDLELLRTSVAEMMQTIPGLRPSPGEADPAFGKITLRDGRTLAYMDRGPRTGTPILYFHGFQGSRLERVPGIDAALTRLNIRLIAPDRPGIGLSTPLHARTIVGWANDVRQLVDQLLGPDQPFSLLGFSAGGTYALACGQLKGLQAISIVGGMGLPHLISGWRRYSEEAWHILLSAKLASLRAETFLRIERKQRDRIFGDWGNYFDEVRRDLSQDDQRLLARPEVEELFRENRREGYAQCPGCLLQEVQALYSDPQIDLAHLSACRVTLIHGADDKVVPVAVARDLHSRIPASRLTELAGRGHYFLYEEGQMENVLAELLEAHNTCLLPHTDDRVIS
jgi:pimeloyl-ACP methyl ester carboxylesterase/1-acyl-sn-glycerol-3-phosphate acyltransferase